MPGARAAGRRRRARPLTAAALALATATPQRATGRLPSQRTLARGQPERERRPRATWRWLRCAFPRQKPPPRQTGRATEPPVGFASAPTPAVAARPTAAAGPAGDRRGAARLATRRRPAPSSPCPGECCAATTSTTPSPACTSTTARAVSRLQSPAACSTPSCWPSSWPSPRCSPGGWTGRACCGAGTPRWRLPAPTCGPSYRWTFCSAPRARSGCWWPTWPPSRYSGCGPSACSPPPWPGSGR
mmetsp:Transcript_18685/g.71008  ORF Transcript_18685/g.71008 Transcript_18685/m.71008 type:complete len:244 (+) Transcript_18685:970-1701(+)